MDATRPTASKVAEDSHSSEVFYVTELFEQIMIHVDMRTLLLAQRVDKHWSTIISTSKPLQQKLFFLPATRAQLIALNTIELGPIIWHPEDDKWWRATQPENRYNICKFSSKCFMTGTTHSSKPFQLAIYNPILFNMPKSNNPVLQHKIRSEPTSTVRPSWEKMLILQPPQPKKLMYFVDTRYSSCQYHAGARNFLAEGDAALLEVLSLAEQCLQEKYKSTHPECVCEIGGPGRNATMRLCAVAASPEDVEEFKVGELDT
ncbi:hypothetical protein CB0940_00631 [Cercospora beticola]|uniref:F-box domain-containing protein n=1 Tax=Cercospora beticola TaxID=122368 RepID=A0A2G5I7H0_CERBT|nr:hypothetical protein CB0940_00631 [Cercospora beticola]PIB00720.1 hypothetical protein CB0940_00631 [Cercospora beticola]WPA96054.1 hypothetical protein RHO25_000660 [Cercospora beticola]CAK1355668.1 unnamed protein product [Cercospora beticola]